MGLGEWQVMADGGANWAGCADRTRGCAGSMGSMEDLSASAREALLAEDRRPLAVTDWRHAVFLHYAVDPAVLQPRVPFDLDLWQGDAYVSVVAFSQLHFRPYRGGGALAWLTWPVANYRFCNVRTYVRYRDEPGVFFLVEWISNPPSVLLARGIYGLPYRYVRSTYEHDTRTGLFTGEVVSGGSRLVLRASIAYDAPLTLPPPGGLDAFCLERYLGMTSGRGRPLRFRIWHPSWRQQSITAETGDDRLLSATGDWYAHARLAAANYSAGIDGVWIGRPRWAV